jgi:A/G-specific adenine glycosylase
MLQQTQVERVAAKYRSFLRAFPTVHALADATKEAVVREWKGLGYNRRALNLKKAAEKIVRDFGGRIPQGGKDLLSLPGVGAYTAAAIQAFAFNMPSIVIETNIRTAVIKHFFSTRGAKKVSDKDIRTIVETTLDTKNPREWYAALMDYGAYIKRTEENFSKRSTTYTKQSAFKGSNRENRSRILDLLFEKPRTKEDILSRLSEKRTETNLAALKKEGFISLSRGRWQLQR